MKPHKLLSAAALSAGVVSGCGSTQVREEPAVAAPKREEVVLQRVSHVVEAEPIPPECGCTAGNGKVPRRVTSAECCEP